MSRGLLRTRSFRWAMVAALGAAGAATAALVIGSGGHHEPLAITDISQNFKVCVLAAGNPAAPAPSPAWAAVSAAARETKTINAEQFTAPTGPARQQIPYLNGLIALRCRLIVVAGPELRGALTRVAKADPAQQFLSYGTGALLPNVRRVPVGDAGAITTVIATDAKEAHIHPAVLHH